MQRRIRMALSGGGYLAAVSALSGHIEPHGHPHPDVINAIEGAQLQAFRIDTGSHLTFTTNGTKPPEIRYSHV